ncbi:ATP-binding protein [Sinomicrobium sp. M5D2P17]
MKPFFDLLKNTLEYRMYIAFGTGENVAKPCFCPPRDEFDLSSPLARFISEHRLGDQDLLLLLLALIPHLSPNYLSDIVSVVLPNGGEFPLFGGVKAKNHRGILPTGETALFLLAGGDMDERVQAIEFIHSESCLFRKKILSMEEVPIGEPKMSGKLILDEEYTELLTTGKILKPKLSTNFPAQLLETEMEWEDLVLNQKTLKQIKEIESWLHHNDILLNEWNMKGKIKPGYRVMLYGPPGTGKTLTASLLGKYTGRDVYRIDLSLVVSKYIGETEKNLSSLFDKATNKDWILFFDEADAIFGKRTNVRDAHDKYANQEVSYLLQRIESHPGLVILASNLKSNIDTAFSRRFQSIIDFDMPTYTERLQLWQNNLPEKIPLAKNVCLKEISRKYDVTGANIVNIIQYTCLKTLEQEQDTIQLEDIVNGIKKEYVKEGKML